MAKGEAVAVWQVTGEGSGASSVKGEGFRGLGAKQSNATLPKRRPPTKMSRESVINRYEDELGSGLRVSGIKSGLFFSD